MSYFCNRKNECNRDCAPDDLRRLQRFFCLPDFYQVEKEDPDGRFVQFGSYTYTDDSDLTGISPYFPGMYYSHMDKEGVVLWWPVCDAE